MQLAYADVEDNALHFRSVSPPAAPLQLLGHRTGFKGAEFADRESIVSAGPEGAIRIWNAITGQELKTIPTGTTSLEVAGSPDGKTIATATMKGVMLWDRASGKAIHQWPDMEETWFLKLAKQGRVLAATGRNGILKLWSTEDGRELHSLKLTNGVHGFAISDDGRQAIAMTTPGCELAFLRAYLNKWDAYHDLCTTALEDFGDTADEKLAERISKMCLFSTKTSVDLDLACSLADLAWGNRKKSTILQWTEMAIGIADLRREKYESAIEHLESSIQGSFQFSIQLATVKFYLSIAYKRMDLPLSLKAAGAPAMKAVCAFRSSCIGPARPRPRFARNSSPLWT